MPKGKHILGKQVGKHIFGTVKVGEKGQIVIPKQARELFEIKPGDTLVLLGDVKRGIAIPPKVMFEKFSHAVYETEEEES